MYPHSSFFYLKSKVHQLSKELETLKKELWKVYQVIKKINAIAEERPLSEDEKEKLQLKISMFKSIKEEIKEEEEKS